MTYLMQSLINSNLFWNDSTGWGNKSNATVFSEEDRHNHVTPFNGRWVETFDRQAHDKAILDDLNQSLDQMMLVDESKVEAARENIVCIVETLLFRLRNKKDEP